MVSLLFWNLGFGAVGAATALTAPQITTNKDLVSSCRLDFFEFVIFSSHFLLDPLGNFNAPFQTLHVPSPPPIVELLNNDLTIMYIIMAELSRAIQINYTLSFGIKLFHCYNFRSLLIFIADSGMKLKWLSLIISLTFLFTAPAVVTASE